MAVAERYPITVEEWQRMAQAGVFDPDLRLELLDGEILVMSPIGPPHNACVDRLTRLFTSKLGDRVIARAGLGGHRRALTAAADAALLRPREDFYRDEMPRPVDIVLLVEVADTSHRRDRHKLRRYAQEGVGEAWLADVEADRLEVHRDLRRDGSASTTVFARGERVSMLAFPDVEFEVGDILP